MPGLPSPALLFSSCAFFILSCFAPVTRAQNESQATLYPNEARALNSLFVKWGVKADTSQWNISGEPCSGSAIDSILFTDSGYNPLIKCVCSFANNTRCRIDQLKVFSLDVVGTIPDELWELTYLYNLDLRENYLSGPLSPSIGNLTRMKYLSFGNNQLSGVLPKELGQLTELLSLSIAQNNFSGTLPPELGNLVKLQQIYIDSSGVSGEIPLTLANLQELITVYASDNELTGSIPDFIGNWSKLNALRLQGNSFQGPIPSTFANLTAMIELRISELSNGSSSFDFIKNMKNLTVLVLRNNNITESIPSNFNEYQQLSQLDLSFNSITGEIPTSLFNMTSLDYLFLGNNKLKGTLPAQKSTTLLNVDLSYNFLAGSLPSWVNQNSLQLNLIGNNLTIGSSSNSLECLQRNFPCNRGLPIYYNFSINCGGPQITTAQGIKYEKENERVGPASFYVADTKRWAVSNIGLFTGNNNPRYQSSTPSTFTNTLDSGLYQTTRLSASSLRYFGLGLENGNYTITLRFSETAFEDARTWKNLGRRVFDIYIQGNLVRKDFDIRKQAGGLLSQVVDLPLKARVSQNFLEVHLFWAGKGTCCVPTPGTYGPAISAISATPDFVPSVSNIPPATKKKDKTSLIVGLTVGAGILSFLSIIAVFIIVRRRRITYDDDEELLGMDVKPFTFTYEELKLATNDFNADNKLGEGGFGPVFKGTLQDGRDIAVKQLSVTSHQGKAQFVAEIATISSVQHRNLVKLYGCCLEGTKRLLVYEYLQNKSLDKALFGIKSLDLNWSTRYEICLGVARGLAYLHEESRLRIVHRDVKSSNILLDANLIPKISDFGLAKLYDDTKTHISTRVAGTIGYLAPEYAMRGHLTEKTDVFAFGVVSLEVVSGRPNSDPNLEEEQMYLLDWAWNLYEGKQAHLLVDPRLSKFNDEEVKRLIGVALLCTQTSPTLRPSMSRAVAMLQGDIEVSTDISRPGYLTDWKFDDVSSIVSVGLYNGSETTYYNSSTAGTSTATTDLEVALSPVGPSQPIFIHSKISEE
ncbi:unnamed protein product [Cuscuta europaea]|uniref:non-specific serine/threonine protein kinase n=1 Tax=Cuscuta europaea TaxID=41803 RepID=A0A9P1EIY1_CUSEU|nr:unnamed protein product [Cuscuta europaea]